MIMKLMIIIVIIIRESVLDCEEDGERPGRIPTLILFMLLSSLLFFLLLLLHATAFARPKSIPRDPYTENFDSHL